MHARSRFNPQGRVLPITCLTLLLAACAPDEPTAPSGASASPGPSLAVASISTVMSGLDAPKGLAWGPEGGLYVVETGTDQVTGPCVAVARGANCFSGTGAVTRLWKGIQERVASGLPSAYNAAAFDIIGAADIEFQGRGNAMVSIGWGGDPAARAGLGAHSAGFGTLIQLRPSGTWKVVADVSALEGAANPAGGPIDSNPYGVLAGPAGALLTDAGGNSLVSVAHDGAVSLVATFGSIPVPPGPFNPPFAQSDAVPTEVRRGPDGALYVSLLTGAPFLPGAASIMRVVPGQSPTVHVGGLTMVTDFDWGPDGSLFVLQYASAPFFGGPAQLLRIAPDGTRSVLTTELSHAAGLLAGPDGALYVSQNSNVPGAGSVVRIVP